MFRQDKMKLQNQILHTKGEALALPPRRSHTMFFHIQEGQRKVVYGAASVRTYAKLRWTQIHELFRLFELLHQLSKQYLLSIDLGIANQTVKFHVPDLLAFFANQQH